MTFYAKMPLSPFDRYKYLGIVLLIIHQTSVPLMTSAARSRDGRSKFAASACVFAMEIIKAPLCCLAIFLNERSLSRFLYRCKNAIVEDRNETLKLSVPSLLYTCQNNLYYVALTHLEPTTYFLVYQLRIFTTALFLRFLLRKHLSPQQWFALVLLAVAVAEVQMQYQAPPGAVASSEQIPAVGFAAVLGMCFTAAFAGVYMEMVFKQSSQGLWVQNLRLCLFGIPLSAMSIYFYDYDTISEGGLFGGFDSLVWSITILSSIGGILTSVVIRYADNIIKTYAQSLAIFGSAIGSWLLFDFTPNLPFVVAAFAVLASIYIYAAYPTRRVGAL